jgi:hypothetical protein
MVQSLLMQAIYKHLGQKKNAELEAALDGLARGFKHTTEGVWNHWSNSTIGRMIRDEVLEEERLDYEAFRTSLDTLYQQIDRFDGKIPYIQDASHPQFPDFRETYQTYDTSLLARMSQFAQVPMKFDQYFPQAFEKAKRTNYEK